MSRRHVLLLAALLLLPACGAIRGMDAHDDPARVEEIRGDGGEAGRALAYYARARKLAGPELAREQEAARRAWTRARTDASRMRYALVLSVPGTAGYDEARVLELLEAVSRNGDSGLQGLALLMTGFLQEQRRLDAQAQGLQQKLDALLTLERSMTGRDSGATRKR